MSASGVTPVDNLVDPPGGFIADGQVYAWNIWDIVRFYFNLIAPLQFTALDVIGRSLGNTLGT